MITKEEYQKVEEFVLKFLDNIPIESENQIYTILKNAKILEENLYNNFVNGNFTMFYQPKFETDGKTTTHSEALFRTKEKFFINPEVAFALFKSFGHEKDLVINHQLPAICSDLKELVDAFGEDYVVSLNIPTYLMNEEFYNKLKTELKNNKLKFSNIEIEFLEYKDFENVGKLPIMDKLKSKGVKFALDDFGSRYANETALNAIDFDIVKIDKEVIKNANTKNDYSEIEYIYSIIKSRNPNIEIIAEGVEDDKDVFNLRRIGEIKYQGYKFSKPVPVNEVIEKFSNKSLEL